MKSIEITDDLYKRLEFVAGCIPQSVETTAYEAILAYVEMLEPGYGVRYGEEKKFRARKKLTDICAISQQAGKDLEGLTCPYCNTNGGNV